MRFAETLGAALWLAVLVMVVPAALAAETNQISEVTFNRPVRISDQTTLPAGTYWFQIMNHLTAPNMVVIYDNDRTHIEARLLTIPTYRDKVRGRTEMILALGTQNHPPILVRWFFRGSHSGHEFVYSPKIEHRIGKEVSTTILAKP